jgi:hypothetical protein
MNRSPSLTAKEDAFDIFGRWSWLLLLLLAIFSAAFFLLTDGCTVRPKVVTNMQPSFDGNFQNSGLIEHDKAGNAVITAHARDRYNALMDRYGKLFSPPVNRDDGITPTATNTFLLDGQHEFIFATANRWRKADLPGRGNGN